MWSVMVTVWKGGGAPKAGARTETWAIYPGPAGEVPDVAKTVAERLMRRFEKEAATGIIDVSDAPDD